VGEIGATAGRKSLVSEDPAAMLDTKVVEVIVTLPESNAWTFGVTVDAAVTVEHREKRADRPPIGRATGRPRDDGDGAAGRIV